MLTEAEHAKHRRSLFRKYRVSEIAGRKRKRRGRLNEEVAVDIYERAHGEETYEEIALDYGIDSSTVSRIKNRRIWKESTEELARELGHLGGGMNARALGRKRDQMLEDVHGQMMDLGHTIGTPTEEGRATARTRCGRGGCGMAARVDAEAGTVEGNAHQKECEG